MALDRNELDQGESDRSKRRKKAGKKELAGKMLVVIDSGIGKTEGTARRKPKKDMN